MAGKQHGPLAQEMAEQMAEEQEREHAIRKKATLRTELHLH